MNRNSKKFKETLPANCPPSQAEHLSDQLVIRFVPQKPATPDHFMSSAAKGDPRPRSVSPCRWASCSVFEATIKPEKIDGLLKYPKLRSMKFQAFLKINSTAGVCTTADSGHIDLWMYDSFDPVAAVARYEPCP